MSHTTRAMVVLVRCLVTATLSRRSETGALAVTAAFVLTFVLAPTAHAFDVVACGGGVAYVAADGSVRISTGSRRSTLLAAAEVAADGRGAIPTLECAGRHVIARVPAVVRAVSVDGAQAAGGIRRIVPPRGFIFMQSVPPSASHDGALVAFGIREDERDGPPSILVADLATGAEPRVVALGGAAVRDAPAPPDSHSDLAFAFAGRTTTIRVLLGARALSIDALRGVLDAASTRLPAGAPALCLARDGVTWVTASRDGTQVRAVRDLRGRGRAPGRAIGATRLPSGRLDAQRCVVSRDGSAVAALRSVPEHGVEIVRLDLRSARSHRTSDLAALPELRHFDGAAMRVLVFDERGAHLRLLDGGTLPGPLPSPPEGWRWIDGTFGDDESRLFLVASRARGVRVERVVYDVRYRAQAVQRVDALR